MVEQFSRQELKDMRTRAVELAGDASSIYDQLALQRLAEIADTLDAIAARKKHDER